MACCGGQKVINADLIVFHNAKRCITANCAQTSAAGPLVDLVAWLPKRKKKLAEKFCLQAKLIHFMNVRLQLLTNVTSYQDTHSTLVTLTAVNKICIFQCERNNRPCGGSRKPGRKNEREKRLDQWSLIQSVISYTNACLKHNLIVCTLPKVVMGFNSILSNLNHWGAAEAVEAEIKTTRWK